MDGVNWKLGRVVRPIGGCNPEIELAGRRNSEFECRRHRQTDWANEQTTEVSVLLQLSLRQIPLLVRLRHPVGCAEAEETSEATRFPRLLARSLGNLRSCNPDADKPF